MSNAIYIFVHCTIATDCSVYELLYACILADYHLLIVFSCLMYICVYFPQVKRVSNQNGTPVSSYHHYLCVCVGGGHAQGKAM